MQVQPEAGCSKDHRLQKTNLSLFGHKITFSRCGITTVSTEGSSPAFFVCAVVNLLSTTLKAEKTTLLLEDFTLSPGFYGLGPASVTSSMHCGGCEIVQKRAIWMRFRGAHGRDFSCGEWMRARFAGCSLAFFRLNTSNNISDQCQVSQIPVCSFGLSLAWLFCTCFWLWFLVSS